MVNKWWLLAVAAVLAVLLVPAIYLLLEGGNEGRLLLTITARDVPTTDVENMTQLSSITPRLSQT